MSASLTRIVAWSQRLAAEVLRSGDLAVDLTAGSGRDSLFLWQQVAPGGRVLAFDIQPVALTETAQRLRQQAVPVRELVDEPVGAAAGVYLAQACHSTLEKWLSAAPRVILANLGYLPGGDPQLVTRPETTLAALDAAACQLEPGGRLLVAVYAGHAGGMDEAAAVGKWFADLAPATWEVVRLQVGNRSRAPWLLAAERRDSGA